MIIDLQQTLDYIQDNPDDFKGLFLDAKTLKNITYAAHRKHWNHGIDCDYCAKYFNNTRATHMIDGVFVPCKFC